MSAGQGDYYIGLAREDYYLENGGEPPGVWYGRGAARIGLCGEVDPVDFRYLFSGFSHETLEKLVQNAGEEHRQCGWDFTFSAPKSVSTVWSQADSERAAEIQEAHRQSVTVALDYLEDLSGFARVGQSGERVEADLIFATFEHGTSRALDPQLHTHALCLNLGVHEGGTNAIVSTDLFRHKMAAGALYRTELAARLGDIGFETEREKTWFEIRDVPRELTDHFSTRRQQVLDQLDAYGSSSAKAAKVAALDTREQKECLPRVELFSQWHEVGHDYGFTAEDVDSLVSRGVSPRSLSRETALAIERSMETLTASQSHFARRDFVRRVAEEGQGRGLSGLEVRAATDAHLEQSRDIIELDQVRGETRFTTREMLELECALMERVQSARSQPAVSLDATRIAERFDPELSREQAAAVRHITSEPHPVTCVYGMAGTGKSRMLASARVAWEHDGFRVLGASLSGKAAVGLEESSGITSRTLQSTLFAIKSGGLELSGNSVVVVDEAGMVGTRQMEELVRACDVAGARLVLVGDWKQLQAIEAGGPFRAIAETVGFAELTDVRRQDEEWMREAVRLFSEGASKRALALFAERGLLSVSADRARAKEQLLSDWEPGGVDHPEENLILVPTRAEAAELNRQAQAARLERLGETGVAIAGDTLFSADRVLFTENNRVLGVSNGSLGTVVSVYPHRRSFTATLDGSGEVVSIPLDHYDQVRLGYAVTTHKSQGMTTQNSFILAGGSMQDRELSYVQASRARGDTRFFTDRIEAGDQLEELERQMRTSREKDLAINHAFTQPEKDRSVAVRSPRPIERPRLGSQGR